MSTALPVLRWKLKKAGRNACALGTPLLKRALGRDRGQAASRVRVLTYHRFGNAARDPFCLPLQDFAAQMRYVAKEGLAISLAKLEAFLAGQAAAPRDGVLITIDDGMGCLRWAALPVLREYAVPAVAFVSAGLVSPGRTASRQGHYLNWHDLETLRDAGISIQSHGWSHRSLGYLHPQLVLDELCASKALLQERLGVDVGSFAYPFGTRSDFNATTANMLSQAGYRLGFTSQHGSIGCGEGRQAHALPRIKVESGESLATFRALVHGGLDAWRWVDLALWRWQSSARG
jgi:peptidoglycan/xylan/chitin deacetylase (PgdA/CDA1 family)